MSKINLEFEDHCGNHKVSFKKRFLLIAWSVQVKCEDCHLRVEGKEPYRSLFFTIIASMVVFIGVLFWAYWGLWVSIILTFTLTQFIMAAVAAIIPLSTERNVRKLK